MSAFYGGGQREEMMNRALISIGANEQADKNLHFAFRWLENHCRVEVATPIITTEPIGSGYEKLFRNQLVWVSSSFSLPEMNDALKLLERQVGRLPHHKWQGVVPLDADILVWNEQVLRPQDMLRPYVKYLLELSGEGSNFPI